MTPRRWVWWMSALATACSGATAVNDAGVAGGVNDAGVSRDAAAATDAGRVTGCDPIAQTGCPAGQGCYPLVSASTTVTTCAAAGTVRVGETITGAAFANSCVPGAMPRRRSSDATTFECGGLCAPVDVRMGANEAEEGGGAARNCQRDWGAAPPDDATNGESCRFFWAREPFSERSPYSNTLGWCYPHARFRYDSDGDMMADAPFPRCTTLTTGDVVPPVRTPPVSDALEFWCAPQP